MSDLILVSLTMVVSRSMVLYEVILTVLSLYSSGVYLHYGTTTLAWKQANLPHGAR
jgi:hypothetical protein